MSSKYMRKRSRSWVLEYPSIKRMAMSIVGRRRRGSPSTVNSYVWGVIRFLDFVNDQEDLPRQYQDPDQLLEAIKSEEINLVDLIDMEATGFIDHCLDVKEYGNKTVNMYVMGVKKWTDSNRVKIPWDMVQLPSTHVTKEEDRAPTDEELKKLLDHCPQIKYRAFILAMISSGLRVGTFLSLRWGDVDLETYPDVGFAMIRREAGRKFGSRGRRSSTPRNLYVTWFSTEAREALLEYKRFREARGELIEPESPLMNSDADWSQALSYSGLHDRWQWILERAGLTMRRGRFYVLHINTLRKWFRSNCVGVDASYREMWMGHKGGYLDASYFRAEQEKQVAEYRKVLPYLSVHKGEAEVKQLQVKMKDLEEKADRVDNVEAELQLIKEILKSQGILEDLLGS